MIKKKPMFWVSKVTGNKFPYDKFFNIEKEERGYKPLPADEYPYGIEYSDK